MNTPIKRTSEQRRREDQEQRLREALLAQAVKAEDQRQTQQDAAFAEMRRRPELDPSPEPDAARRIAQVMDAAIEGDSPGTSTWPSSVRTDRLARALADSVVLGSATGDPTWHSTALVIAHEIQRRLAD